MVIGGVAGYMVYATRPSAPEPSPVVAAPPPKAVRKQWAKRSPAAVPGGTGKVIHIAIPKNAPFKGPADAAIVIVEFSDFQCPFCNHVSPTLQRILNENDDVKVVWRHHPLPFHKNAPLAHEAAVEAYVQQGNDGFWKMHDLLFSNQRRLDKENLIELAAQAGLNTNKLRAALADRRHRARVAEGSAAAAAAGVSGTPNFFINGHQLRGAQPYGSFEKMVKQARAAIH